MSKSKIKEVMWKCESCGFVIDRINSINKAKAYCLRCGKQTLKNFDPLFRHNK